MLKLSLDVTFLQQNYRGLHLSITFGVLTFEIRYRGVNAKIEFTLDATCNRAEFFSQQV
jgi:hypothetical protein